MDLRTESLDFNVFQLFICLFLTADRLSRLSFRWATELSYSQRLFGCPRNVRLSSLDLQYNALFPLRQRVKCADYKK